MAWQRLAQDRYGGSCDDCGESWVVRWPQEAHLGDPPLLVWVAYPYGRGTGDLCQPCRNTWDERHKPELEARPPPASPKPLTAVKPRNAFAKECLAFALAINAEQGRPREADI